VTGVIHPAPMLMNAGRIESTAGDFLFYREGMTSAVGKVMHAVDMERCAIASGLGLALPSALEMMNRYYGLHHDDLSSFAFHSHVHNVEKSTPDSLQHRYLLQDIPYVLTPWAALGRRLGVATRAIDSLIRLACLATGETAMGGERTLASIGLDRLTASQLSRLAVGETIDAP
jgi:opine dehydrogenase